MLLLMRRWYCCDPSLNSRMVVVLCCMIIKKNVYQIRLTCQNLWVPVCYLYKQMKFSLLRRQNFRSKQTRPRVDPLRIEIEWAPILTSWRDNDWIFRYEETGP